MNENEFWQIIDKLDWNGDEHEDVVEPVIDYLTSKSDEELFEFEELLAQKLFALDTKAHAKESGEYGYTDDDSQYFSVDSFLYARACVVAEGEEFYNKVLNNPKEFPKDVDFESLLYVAPEAFERKNDEEWDYDSPTCYETFQNRQGWE